MEVHAHTHLASGETHTVRKKWTHYLWEFLMLFLAVFCGFLAENQREHMVENRREKQYMKSMLDDLRTDTSEVSDELLLAKSQLSITDTQMAIINNRDLSEGNISKLYQLHFSSRLVGPYFEDRTSAQLKNAGGMRLIHKQQVADSLSRYWRSIKLCETMTQLYETYAHDISDISVRIFDNKYITETDIGQPPSEIKPGARFISSQPELLSEYSNRLRVKRNLLRFFIYRLQLTNRYAIGLMDIIRKEYHLE